MPFRKATNYSRFNVGEYMRQKRLGWIAKVETNKEQNTCFLKLQCTNETCVYKLVVLAKLVTIDIASLHT